MYWMLEGREETVGDYEWNQKKNAFQEFFLKYISHQYGFIINEIVREYGAVIESNINLFKKKYGGISDVSTLVLETIVYYEMVATKGPYVSLINDRMSRDLSEVLDSNGGKIYPDVNTMDKQTWVSIALQTITTKSGQEVEQNIQRARESIELGNYIFDRANVNQQDKLYYVECLIKGTFSLLKYTDGRSKYECPAGRTVKDLLEILYDSHNN